MPPAPEATVAKLKRMRGEHLVATIEQRFATHRAASTSQEIAEAAALNERYVREWLGAMTAAGIVHCDDRGERYELPAAHRALLSREPGTDNLAPLTQYFSMFGRVEDRIVECFRRGGGVPYEAYDRFHEVMMDESDQSVVGALFDHILPLIPGIEGRP